MTPSRPEEIADRQKRNGDRNACTICCPKPNQIRADQLWAWSCANPGKKPLR